MYSVGSGAPTEQGKGKGKGRGKFGHRRRVLRSQGGGKSRGVRQQGPLGDIVKGKGKGANAFGTYSPDGFSHQSFLHNYSEFLITGPLCVWRASADWLQCSAAR